MGSEGRGGIDGLSKADAVDAVLDEDDSLDREMVETLLEDATESGIVSWASVEEELAHLSKVVSTPETRLELAQRALAEAEKTAAPVEDLPIVQHRLSDHRGRLTRIETVVADLGDELQSLLQRSRDREDLFSVIRRIQELKTEANRLQGAADELRMDLDEFERWISQQEVQVRQFAGDLDAIEESLSDLGETVDGIQDRRDVESIDCDGVNEEDAKPDPVWADTLVEHRLIGLMIEDALAELADLHDWADRERLDTEPLETFEARLDTIEAEWKAIGDRLETVAAPEWWDRYEAEITAVDATIEQFDPPVDWGRVQAALETPPTD